MKRTTPPKRKKPPTRRRAGGRNSRTARPAARASAGIPDDAPPDGWPTDDEPAPEPEPEVMSDSLWDWEEEELDYAQDIELEQYALRVLRGEHDD